MKSKKIVKESADKHKEKTHDADTTDFIYSFMQEQERMTQAGEDMEGFTGMNNLETSRLLRCQRLMQ